MKVKICGVTTSEDALMCARAGADLIGLNFYPPSPRCLTIEAAARIAAVVKALPAPPQLVGVFVNQPPPAMLAVLDQCGLDLAQLSGDETFADLEALAGRGFKALRDARSPMLAGQLARDQLLLFDAHVPGQYGGTARTANWDEAANLAGQCRLLLAGGLTPDNVSAAIAYVHPWGVDVASGVESAPGKKDPAKVHTFIERAKTS